MVPRVFVGVDIGKASHSAVGIDEAGETIHRRAVDKDEAGLSDLVQWAVEHEAAILTSRPGVGPRLGARITVEIGDVRRFKTPAHLAAYAGLGPTPRQSGTSIRGNVPSRHGTHRLKDAFFLAAFASLKHPPSRTYYDRKRTEGKRHNQAVLCLARRRVDVLHAMLTRRLPYQIPAPPLPKSA